MDLKKLFEKTRESFNNNSFHILKNDYDIHFGSYSSKEYGMKYYSPIIPSHFSEIQSNLNKNIVTCFYCDLCYLSNKDAYHSVLELQQTSNKFEPKNIDYLTRGLLFTDDFTNTTSKIPLTNNLIYQENISILNQVIINIKYNDKNIEFITCPILPQKYQDHLIMYSKNHYNLYSFTINKSLFISTLKYCEILNQQIPNS